MNRYRYPNYKRPRVFEDFRVGDRIFIGEQHGTIFSFGPGNSAIIDWDIQRTKDRPYNLEELSHE